MTIAQFAAIIGKSPHAVRHMVLAGKINALQIGQRWDIPKDELARYRAEGEIPLAERQKQTLVRPVRKKVNSPQDEQSTEQTKGNRYGFRY